MSPTIMILHLTHLTHLTHDNNSAYGESIDNLDDDDSSIILNPSGVDHHGPIVGVETIHYDHNDPEEEPSEEEAEPE